MVNLYQDTDGVAHKAILSYDENKEDGFYGLLSVAYCIVGSKIYKAKVDSILAGNDPITNIADWEEFGAGGGGGGIAGKIVLHSTSDSTATIASHHVVDTTNGHVTLTLPIDGSILDGTILSVENAGVNTVSVVTTAPYNVNSLPAVVIKSGEFYEFAIDKTLQTWQVTMKELNAVIGKVSHLVGFYDKDGELKVDIVPLLGNVTYDISKYNLDFDNGQPAWRIVNEAVGMEQLADTYGVTIT